MEGQAGLHFVGDAPFEVQQGLQSQVKVVEGLVLGLALDGLGQVESGLYALLDAGVV